MIAFVAALEEELSNLLQKAEVVRQLEIGGSPVHEARLAGKEVLLARSGQGRNRTKLMGDFLAKSYPLSTLVSIGYAGAVREGIRSSDIVLCETFYAQGKDETFVSDATLLLQAAKALEEAKIRYHRGNCFTASQIMGEPQAKAELGRSLAVMLVELETYWLAQMAAHHGIPFLAIQTVLDEVSDWVPSEPFVDDTGIIQRSRAMGYLMRHPDRAPAMIRLGSAVPKASASLAAAVLAFLQRSPAFEEAS